MIPPTSQRVKLSTCESVNHQIRHEMEQRIAHYRHANSRDINARLAELEQEWDIERVLETNASTLIFCGSLLTATVNRRWAFLPLVVSGFLLQHAVQGWCPPLPILRRLGVRTMREIDEERFALKALRGDFQDIEKGLKYDDQLSHIVSRG